MKTQILLFSLLASSFISAQQSSDSLIINKNTIKTNLTAYAFRNFNLTYERSINKTIAVSATFATMPKGDVPFLNSFVKEEDREDIGDIQLGNTAFTLETRFYFGKKYNSGFYLAPYYRYTNMKIDEIRYNFYTYDEDTNVETNNPIDLNGKFSAHSFGLMIGVQWLLGKKQNWVLDWWLIGGHYGFAKGDLAGKTKYALTPEEQQDLQDEINDLNIPIVKYEAHINANGGTVKLDGPWAGLRSGLSLGYRF
ncbi:DUF3575 domain-containing protein [Soonwooa purpurea]